MTLPTIRLYTARIHTNLTDPDLLDITRATADRRTKEIEDWEHLDDRARRDAHIAGIDVAKTRLRAGLSLMQVQALARDDGLPSLGAAWAPPWSILNPALGALELAEKFHREAISSPFGADRLNAIYTLEERSWNRYVHGETRGEVVVSGYHEAMRRSYLEMKAAWAWMLSLPRVVLGCLCKPPLWWPEGKAWNHCHRFEAATLIAKVGVRVGRTVVLCGELPEEPSPQLGLPIG